MKTDRASAAVFRFRDSTMAVLHNAPFVISKLPVNQSGAGEFAVAPERAVSRRPCIGFHLAASLRTRWVLYVGRLEEFNRRCDEKAVHELRVASRRLMAQLDLFAMVLGSRDAEKACRALKRNLKTLGRLRDLQVQRSFLEPEVKRFPELTLVCHHLEEREQRLAGPVSATVRELKPGKFEKWISLMLEELAEKTNDLRNQAYLTVRVMQVLKRAYAGVVRCRRKIKINELETIHRTRVAFKKFRYLVESLSPVMTGFDERQLRRLASYQRKMGRIQDLDVMQSCIAAFVRKYGASEELLQPFQKRLQRLQQRAVRSFMKDADQILKFRPPRPRLPAIKVEPS